jgi:hypothetical protein
MFRHQHFSFSRQSLTSGSLIVIAGARYRSSRTGGVTFGALMDTLKTMLVEDKKVIARGDAADYRESFCLPLCDEGCACFGIEVDHTVAVTSNFVWAADK